MPDGLDDAMIVHPRAHRRAEAAQLLRLARKDAMEALRPPPEGTARQGRRRRLRATPRLRARRRGGRRPRRRQRRPARGGLLESREPDGQPLAPALDEAVRVEDEQRARFEPRRGVMPGHPEAGQRGRLGAVEPGRRSLGGENQHRRVAGRGVLDLARGRIEHHVADRREVGRPRTCEEPVEPAQKHAGRLGVLCERPERGPHLPHRGGRGETVADDVADREADPPVRELERVVPVTADLEHVAAGLVVRCEREPRAADEAGRAGAPAATRSQSRAPPPPARAAPRRRAFARGCPYRRRPTRRRRRRGCVPASRGRRRGGAPRTPRARDVRSPERGLRSPSPGPTPYAGCLVVGMDRVEPAEALVLLQALPRVLAPRRLRIDETAHRVGCPGDVGDDRDERAEALLRLLALGDVDSGRMEEADVAQPVEDRVHPEVDETLGAVGEPVAERLAEDVPLQRLSRSPRGCGPASPPSRATRASPRTAGRAPRRACTRTTRRRARSPRSGLRPGP